MRKKEEAPSEELKIGQGKAGPGRPKGVASRRQVGDKLRVDDLLTEKGYDPIGALIDIALDDKTSAEERKAIALVILPYVYSKQPSESSAIGGDEDGEGGKGFTFRVLL